MVKRRPERSKPEGRTVECESMWCALFSRRKHCCPGGRRRRWVAVGGAIVVFGGALCLTRTVVGAEGAGRSGGILPAAPAGSAVPARAAVSASAPAPANGEELARKVCSGCHLVPEPDLLDRKTWEVQILPRMEARLGVTPPDYSSSPEGELLRSLEIYPKEPLIPRADWDAIVAYYLQRAPAVPLPQEPHAEIGLGLPLFRFEPVRFRFQPSLTTLVQIGPLSRRIYLGDDQARRLAVLDATGKLETTLALDNVAVGVAEMTNGIYVTCVGSFLPSEIQRGALLFFPRDKDGFGPRRVVVDQLPRAAQTEFADLDGDGDLDFAMCLYGNHRGRFSWFRNLGGERYEEERLIEKSGAIRCLARDFDGNGTLDLALLMAQENETFQIFSNEGPGVFHSEYVFQRPPVYGHNHFEIADFDRDGLDDLLVSNGDNGEFTSPPKRFHGLRIYRGRGGGRFHEQASWFFPLNGATKALARDFDQDGDLDLAVIAYFPDYDRSPRESFVYFENRGIWNFVPTTFPQCIAGRWLTLDAGDLDGDGDLDLVLGSYVRGPTTVPAFLTQSWEKDGPSAVILRNRLR